MAETTYTSADVDEIERQIPIWSGKFADLGMEVTATMQSFARQVAIASFAARTLASSPTAAALDKCVGGEVSD